MRPSIEDDDTLYALEKAANHMGISKTEAVRLAVRYMYVNEDIGDRQAADLHDDSDQRKAHQLLYKMAEPIPQRENLKKTKVSAAKSLLAQEFGMAQSTVKEIYLNSLNDKKVIDIKDQLGNNSVYVTDPTATIAPASSDDDSEEITNDSDDAADRMDQLEAAEPVRADGGADETVNNDDMET